MSVLPAALAVGKLVIMTNPDMRSVAVIKTMAEEKAKP